MSEPGQELQRVGDGANRRPPFEQANAEAVTHGAYAELRLAPRADELAETIGDLVPGYRLSDEPAVRIAALAYARVQAAVKALEDAGDPSQFARLEADLRGWVNTLTKLLDKLGMTPTGRARLGLDVANTKRAVTLTQMRAEREARAAQGQEQGEEAAG